jgi:hypothetical protein
MYDVLSELFDAKVLNELNRARPEMFRAQICKSFKKPSNRFHAWRAGRTALFHLPALQATA